MVLHKSKLLQKWEHRLQEASLPHRFDPTTKFVPPGTLDACSSDLLYHFMIPSTFPELAPLFCVIFGVSVYVSVYVFSHKITRQIFCEGLKSAKTVTSNFCPFLCWVVYLEVGKCVIVNLKCIFKCISGLLNSIFVPILLKCISQLCFCIVELYFSELCQYLSLSFCQGVHQEVGRPPRSV